MHNDAMQQPPTSTPAPSPCAPLIRFDRMALARRVAPDTDGLLHDPAVRGIVQESGLSGAASLPRAEAYAAIALVSKLLQGVLEQRLEPLSLTLQHCRTLGIVRAWGGDGPQLRAIAEHLRVTPRTVTAIVDSLAAAGLVERVPDPGDRRAVTARLTEEGRRRAREAARIQAATIDELLGDIDDTELAQLRHLCYRLILRAGGPLPAEAPSAAAAQPSRA